jgi:hypothetical protein
LRGYYLDQGGIIWIERVSSNCINWMGGVSSGLREYHLSII